MSFRTSRFLVPALVTLAIFAIALFIFSFFGGEELAIGNLVLRAQKGTSYPLQAPPISISDVRPSVPTVGERGDPAARNAILFIGDGMGIGHVSAASDLLSFPGGILAMTDTPHVALVRSWVADNLAPDSASTGTAMATGFKTRKKAVGVLEDGRVVRNLFEVARDHGRTTGIITTSGVVDATPATFTVHVDWRDDYHEIFEKMLASGTDLLIGGDWTRFSKAKKNPAYLDLLARAEELGQHHGYEVIREPSSLATTELPLLALFPPRPSGGNSHGPPLAATVLRGIELLRGNSAGFVLLVECEITDEFGHSNDIEEVMQGMRELDEAVAAALEAIGGDGDTLVVVTADHDTGSLAVIDGDYEEGRATVRWATGDHSSQWLPLFAFGPGAERFTGVLDNTEVGQLIAEALGLEGFPQLAELVEN
jgi:alkaline phosphatase